MRTVRKASIIGLLAAFFALVIPQVGCQSAAAIDQQAPWVQRDRRASVEFTRSRWVESEAKRPGHLRMLEEDVRLRYQRSVEDFKEIPLIAYMMIY